MFLPTQYLPLPEQSVIPRTKQDLRPTFLSKQYTDSSIDFSKEKEFSKFSIIAKFIVLQDYIC